MIGNNEIKQGQIINNFSSSQIMTKSQTNLQFIVQGEESKTKQFLNNNGQSQYRPRVQSRSHSPTQRSKMAGSDNFRNDATALLQVG